MSTTGFARFFDRLLLHGLEYFGLFYGVYRATVVSTTNENGDPDPQGRIRVRVPSIGDGDDVERLAYPIVPLAGAGFGIHAMPRVDEFVWVMFENGRVDIPIWIGGWWRTDDIPSDLRAIEKHWWVTQGGHQVILDDSDDDANIRINHSNGTAYVQIDKDGNILVVNSTGSQIRLGGSANEAAVKGDTLKDILASLTDACSAMTMPVSGATAGPPTNVASFQSVRARLENILSSVVKLE